MCQLPLIDCGQLVYMVPGCAPDCSASWLGLPASPLPLPPFPLPLPFPFFPFAGSFGVSRGPGGAPA
eukprot:5489602-Prorocentrum_lima.AAC.1